MRFTKRQLEQRVEQLLNVVKALEGELQRYGNPRVGAVMMRWGQHYVLLPIVDSAPSVDGLQLVVAWPFVTSDKQPVRPAIKEASDGTQVQGRRRRSAV